MGSLVDQHLPVLENALFVTDLGIYYSKHRQGLDALLSHSYQIMNYEDFNNDLRTQTAIYKVNWIIFLIH